MTDGLPDAGRPASAEAGAGGPGGDVPPAPRARRQDALRTEALVVQVATRVMADAPDATMQDVADAAGLGRATVYRHFATREDLMEAITRAAFQEMGDILKGLRLDEGDAVTALHRAMDAIFEVGDRYRFLAERPHGMQSAEKERAVTELFAPVITLVERARAEGVIRADAPVEWVQAALGGLLGAAMRQLAAGTIARADATGLVVGTLLDGLGARPAG